MTAADETRRVSLAIDGLVFDRWTRVEITRDLSEISAGFTLDVVDAARLDAAFPGAPLPPPIPPALDVQQPAVLRIDGEVVLTGWIDTLRLRADGTGTAATISGYDTTHDLVDCAAAPEGPAEYRGLTLTQIAERICAPFGIAVRADVDVGDAFPRFGIDPAETAMEALEKAARQRGVLLVGDGLGGLLITRGGQRRGPYPLRLGELVGQMELERSSRDRFRDYWVKGQTERAGGTRAAAPALVRTATPLGADAPPPPAITPRSEEARGVVMTGHARDGEVARYRPKVTLARSQSGGASVQDQADWQLRVARGLSDRMRCTVADWRAGDDRALWRPNELVLVEDAYSGQQGDMLVSGVTYSFDERGIRTELRLNGPDAFDLLPEPETDTRRGRDRKAPAKPLVTTATPLGG